MKTKSKTKSKTGMKAKVTKGKGSKIAIGKPVGDFKVDGTGGREVQLSDFKGKNVVLYFYPKDDTPGCTLEGQDFSRLKSDFGSADAEIFGISRDSIASHEKFKDKYCYSIDLLSDSEEKLCKQFDVIKMKNMYGKMVQGIERSTFVLDRDGVLRKEWRKVKVDGHAQEVLDFVKTL